MRRVLQRSDPIRWSVAASLACSVLVATPSSTRAQVVRIDRAENLRIEPNGALLGQVEPGNELPLVETRDTWVLAELEGWVWARSLQVTDRDGFDLVVSAEGGENIRVRPQGAEVGRLEEGALLEELERIPGWILVRRQGWIWRASVTVDEEAPPVRTASAGAVGTDAAPTEPAVGDTTPPASLPTSDVGPTGDSTGVPTVRPFRIESGTVVRRAPEGDTLAVVEEPGRVAIVGSEGEWARVLIEGWVRLPEGTSVDPVTSGSPTTLGPDPGAAGAGGTDLGIDDVVTDPARATGATVIWELQFISLERAGPGRPEFTEGEAYLLMRPAGEGTGRFVYVVIPDANVAMAEDFVPLERLSVRGRIRMGASPVTGGPVVDLIEMTRRR